MTTFEKINFEIIDIVTYGFILLLGLLTWIYGIENVKRLGRIIEEKSK